MEPYNFKYCGLNVTLNTLSGKWKAVILYQLFNHGEMRFTQLWRIIPKVTKKVLLEHLKQMENAQLVARNVKSGYPPEVYYSLSDKGRALGPALVALDSWANEHAPEDVKLLRSKNKAHSVLVTEE